MSESTQKSKSKSRRGKGGKQKNNDKWVDKYIPKDEAVPDKSSVGMKVQDGVENLRLEDRSTPDARDSSSTRLNPEAVEFKIKSAVSGFECAGANTVSVHQGRSSGNQCAVKEEQDQAWGNNEETSGRRGNDDARGENVEISMHQVNNDRTSENQWRHHSNRGRPAFKQMGHVDNLGKGREQDQAWGNNEESSGHRRNDTRSKNVETSGHEANNDLTSENQWSSGSSRGQPAFKQTGRVDNFGKFRGTYTNTYRKNNGAHHNYPARDSDYNNHKSSRGYSDRRTDGDHNNPKSNEVYSSRRSEGNYNPRKNEGYTSRRSEGNDNTRKNEGSTNRKGEGNNQWSNGGYNNRKTDSNFNQQKNKFPENEPSKEENMETSEDWFEEAKLLEKTNENPINTEKSFEMSTEENESFFDVSEEQKNKDSPQLSKFWESDPNSYKPETPYKINVEFNPYDISTHDIDDELGDLSPEFSPHIPSKGYGKNVTRQSYDGNRKKEDKFDDYERKFRKAKMEHERVIEVEGDLFSAGEEYALAHCVAEDMNMGSGIALMFRKTYGSLDLLFNQKQKQGGLAFLEHNGRYIYYLVTKRESNKKPTLETMFKSLNKLKDNMVENSVKKLAIPRIGCGLDRLEWSEVKNMLEYVFKETDIEIKVFNFQKADDVVNEKRTDHKFRKCYVTNLQKTIENFHTTYAMILFLGTEQGDETPQIKAIDERFKILRDYKQAEKTIGSYNCFYRAAAKYCIVNIIIKKRLQDKFDFGAFEKAIFRLNKENVKAAKENQKYDEVVMHEYKVADDSLFMAKITNLMRNTFYQVKIGFLDL